MPFRLVRQLIGCCLFLICCITANATHYKGGEVAYRQIGPDIYQITFRIYSDCHHGDSLAISQDLPLYYSVFDSAGLRGLVDTGGVGTFISLPMNFVAGCMHDTNDYCSKYAIVQRNIRLPASTAGYLLLNQRCCMGSARNILNSLSAGITLQVHIPGTDQLDSVTATNSSPSFNAAPPLRLCINTSFAFDFSATDPDSDSLAYRFETGYNGGTSNDAKPIPSATVLAPLQYAPGFSYSNPLGGNGMMRINAATGLVSGMCRVPGDYLVSVACDEYRSGKRIGTVYRTYVVEINDCGKETIATIKPDSAALNIGIDSVAIVRCTGARSVQFRNLSTGALAYHWDFGVSSTSDDTSSAVEPAFTYPAAGRYPLTLIAYGKNCNDTLHAFVWLSDDVAQPSFSISGSYCVLDTLLLTDNSTTTGSITQSLWQINHSALLTGDVARMPLVSPGPAVITHTIVTSNSCIAAIDQDINVRQANVTVSGDTFVIQNAPLLLQAGGASIYNWFAIPPASFTNYVPGEANQQVSTNVIGKNFTFVLQARDAQGCGSIDTVHVTVVERPYIFVPTAFSPNNDGLNDFLRAHIAGCGFIAFNIYNRLGNEVFSSTNAHQGWDGRYKGQEAAMDTYYWMLRVRSITSGSELVFSGDVFLVR